MNPLVATPPVRPPGPPPRPAPPRLPGVWRADGLLAGRHQGRPTGHAALDAELPGGGWPCGGLIELLSEAPGLQEPRLLAPAWAQPCGGWVAWVLPERLPLQPHAPGLQHLGVAPSRVLCLRPAGQADAAWAVEQLVHSGVVTSVWWLDDHVRTLYLRRVHWAAQAAGVPVWLSRHRAHLADPSPAPLRLNLQPLAQQQLSLELVKRPGPRLLRPLVLPLGRGEALGALPPRTAVPDRVHQNHPLRPAQPVQPLQAVTAA